LQYFRDAQCLPGTARENMTCLHLAVQLLYPLVPLIATRKTVESFLYRIMRHCACEFRRLKDKRCLGNVVQTTHINTQRHVPEPSDLASSPEVRPKLLAQRISSGTDRYVVILNWLYYILDTLPVFMRRWQVVTWQVNTPVWTTFLFKNSGLPESPRGTRKRPVWEAILQPEQQKKERK